VKEDGALIVGRNNLSQGHIDLAGGTSVRAAGEVRLYGGQIKFIDNASGHYKPNGIEARQAAESAFRNAGFNIEGKYIERF
jgi:hypothetical protein